MWRSSRWTGCRPRIPFRNSRNDVCKHDFNHRQLVTGTNKNTCPNPVGCLSNRNGGHYPSSITNNTNISIASALATAINSTASRTTHRYL